MTTLYRLASTLLFLLIASAPATAQISVTALRGIVQDPSGAVIPGVELRLRDMATGIEKATQSTEEAHVSIQWRRPAESRRLRAIRIRTSARIA